MNKTISIILPLLLLVLPVSSQTRDTIKVFNEEHPLVYEDAWDLWPYVFLNENGEPDGYNIDLLKMIFKELDIPYIIKLKPTLEAQEEREVRPHAAYGCLFLTGEYTLQQKYYPIVYTQRCRSTKSTAEHPHWSRSQRTPCHRTRGQFQPPSD